MSSVLDRADHVKRASLEESGPPTLINKKFRIDAAPGRFWRLCRSACEPGGAPGARRL